MSAQKACVCPYPPHPLGDVSRVLTNLSAWLMRLLGGWTVPSLSISQECVIMADLQQILYLHPKCIN
jgi:hypothetical protein